MHNILKALVIPGLLAVPAVARDVPSNVRSLYDSIRSSGSCSNVLKGGFYSQEDDTKGIKFASVKWGVRLMGYRFLLLR